MYKAIMLPIIFIFSWPIFAAEFEFSAGAGPEYGGVLGGQFSYKTDSSKYYGAIGLVGIAVGFQSVFMESAKHTYGATIGRTITLGEDGFVFFNYNYHVGGFHQDGWVVGAGLGIARGTDGDFWGGEIETKPKIIVNLGYKF